MTNAVIDSLMAHRFIRKFKARYRTLRRTLVRHL